MNQSTATVQSLHNPRKNWIERFALASLISAADIEHCTAIELYAVSGEHWMKCTPCAKAFLMTHQNPAISAHAKMMSACFADGPTVAVA